MIYINYLIWICVLFLPILVQGQHIENVELSDKSDLCLGFSSHGDYFSYMTVEIKDTDVHYNGYVVKSTDFNQVVSEFKEVNFIQPINDSKLIVIDEQYNVQLYDNKTNRVVRKLDLNLNLGVDVNDIKVGRYLNGLGVFVLDKTRLSFYNINGTDEVLVLDIDSVKDQVSFVSFAVAGGKVIFISEGIGGSLNTYQFEFNNQAIQVLKTSKKSKTRDYFPVIEYVNDSTIIFSKYLDDGTCYLSSLNLNNGSSNEFSFDNLRILNISSNRKGTIILSILSNKDRELYWPFESIKEFKETIFKGINSYAFYPTSGNL